MSIYTNNMKETNILLYTDVKYSNSESFLISSIVHVGHGDAIPWLMMSSDFHLLPSLFSNETRKRT